MLELLLLVFFHQIASMLQLIATLQPFKLCCCWCCCLQDKEEALQALAAAAADRAHRPSSSGGANGGGRQLLTEQEKAALRDSGKQARETASRQLAAAVDSSDAALRAMSQQDREQWFQVSRRNVHVMMWLPTSTSAESAHMLGTTSA
jgi:hypothetical protein